MKYLTLLLLACSCLFFACDDDENDFDADANAIRIDGPNDTSPNQPGGLYELAIRLDPNDLAQVINQEITAVRYYGYTRPTSCQIRIYDQGISDDVPGIMLYEADITDEFGQNSWNDHLLNQPLTVTNRGIWLAVRYSIGGQQQTLGCDSGPNRNGGDFLMSNSTNGWTTFTDITNGAESVNWNIRAVVN